MNSWYVDSDSGQVSHQLEGSVKWIRCAAWSRDGRMLLACDDREAWIWDTQTGQALQLLEGHTTAIEAVSWLADGQQVMTRDTHGRQRRWIVATELLEAELVRRVGEVHVEARHYDREADKRVRQRVSG